MCTGKSSGVYCGGERGRGGLRVFVKEIGGVETDVSGVVWKRGEVGIVAGGEGIGWFINTGGKPVEIGGVETDEVPRKFEASGGVVGGGVGGVGIVDGGGIGGLIEIGRGVESGGLGIGEGECT